MLLKVLIITALLHELSCDNDEDLQHHVIIVPNNEKPEDSCDAVLIKPKFLLSSFPCLHKLSETYNNVPLRVLAGLEILPGEDGKFKGYEQHADVDNYSVSKSGETAIVRVKESFKKSKFVDFALLPEKGEKICEEATTLTTFITEKSKHKRGVWDYISGWIKWIKKKFTPKKKKKHKKRPRYKWQYEWAPWEETKNKVRFVGAIEGIPPDLCKKSKGWPLYCDKTIWGFQTMCEQSKTRAGGFDLEMSDVSHDLDFIAKQTGVKTKNGEDSSKKKAKGSGFITRATDEIIWLVVVYQLLEILKHFLVQIVCQENYEIVY